MEAPVSDREQERGTAVGPVVSEEERGSSDDPSRILSHSSESTVVRELQPKRRGSCALPPQPPFTESTDGDGDVATRLASMSLTYLRTSSMMKPTLRQGVVCDSPTAAPHVAPSTDTSRSMSLDRLRSLPAADTPSSVLAPPGTQPVAALLRRFSQKGRRASASPRDLTDLMESAEPGREHDPIIRPPGGTQSAGRGRTDMAPVASDTSFVLETKPSAPPSSSDDAPPRLTLEQQMQLFRQGAFEELRVLNTGRGRHPLREAPSESSRSCSLSSDRSRQYNHFGDISSEQACGVRFQPHISTPDEPPNEQAPIRPWRPSTTTYDGFAARERLQTQEHLGNRERVGSHERFSGASPSSPSGCAGPANQPSVIVQVVEDGRLVSRRLSDIGPLDPRGNPVVPPRQGLDTTTTSSFAAVALSVPPGVLVDASSETDILEHRYNARLVVAAFASVVITAIAAAVVAATPLLATSPAFFAIPLILGLVSCALLFAPRALLLEVRHRERIVRLERRRLALHFCPRTVEAPFAALLPLSAVPPPSAPGAVSLTFTENGGCGDIEVPVGLEEGTWRAWAAYVERLRAEGCQA